jgi:hypothetical protein
MAGIFAPLASTKFIAVPNRPKLGLAPGCPACAGHGNRIFIRRASFGAAQD